MSLAILNEQAAMFFPTLRGRDFELLKLTFDPGTDPTPSRSALVRLSDGAFEHHTDFGDGMVLCAKDLDPENVRRIMRGVQRHECGTEEALFGSVIVTLAVETGVHVER